MKGREREGLTLAVDAVGNKFGGGATVLMEIVEAALASDAISRIVLFASPTNKRRFAFPDDTRLRVIDMSLAESAAGRLWWAWRGFGASALKSKCDVSFGLNGIAARGANACSVVFVQQPVPYCREALAHFSPLMRLRMSGIRGVTGRSARAADAVFVQNPAFRDEIVSALKIDINKVQVFVPSAPFMDKAQSLPESLRPMCQRPMGGVLLYVGNAAEHKNLPIVAAGLKTIPLPQRPMWCATLPRDSRFCREGAVSLGSLARNELPYAYEMADVVVMSSFTETVGLPMLEAMRMGTPVLAADRPYAHAICEDAAMFFEPTSPRDFAMKLLRVMGDQATRQELVEKGHRVLAKRDVVSPYRRMVDELVRLGLERGRDRSQSAPE
jgi:glycosyltransferase involved in cell wall biosynthesis